MATKNISRFGKNFLVEVAGTSITDDEKKLLEKLQPTAILLRSRNFLQDADYDTWLEAYKNLIAQFRSILPDNLIISIDHEGGRVIRPPAPITKFPYAANWGNDVEEIAKAMAIELKSLAINVNFAPVADIHSNPDNPVINQRAFGTNPEAVSKAVLDFVKALENNGVLACAKHFPGHGDTKIDSHFGLPTLNLSLNELRQRELVPFQALIDHGIKMIMTAHILFPQIDAENTATYSKRILDYLLRKEMGFHGVIIADALGMGAVINNMSTKENVIKALNAGLDIFLVAGDRVSINTALEMAEIMSDSLQDGSLSEAVISQSQERVDKFRKNLPQYEVNKVEKSVLEQHRKLAEKAATNEIKEFELNLPGFD